MKTQYQLFQRYAQDIPSGKLEWIGLRPARKAPVISVESAHALEGLGLEGDHRCLKTPGSGRQVTIISREFIEMIGKSIGNKNIEPGLLRRNLVISGINLNAVRYQKLKIGEAVFELNAHCHPCQRMNQNLGPGGLAAMMGYGGFCAKVTRGGVIRLNDTVTVLLDDGRE